MPFYISFPFRDKQELLSCAALHKLYNQQKKNGPPNTSENYRSMLFSSVPLNAELNPICHLLALLGGQHIHHVSRVKVKFHGSCLPYEFYTQI